MKTFLAWLVLCSALAAQITTKTMTPGVVLLPYEVSGDSASILWEARQPVDLAYETIETGGEATIIIGRDGTLTRLSSGKPYSLCKFEGKAGETVIVSVFDFSIADGKPNISKKTWQVEFEGEPEPDPTPPGPEPEPEPTPPDPTPPPDITNPLGKQIYKKAVLVNDPENAGKIADVFGGIASRIAAGGYNGKSVQDVANDIVSGVSSLNLPRKWAEFGAFLTKEFERQVNTMSMARGLTEVTAKALYAAAGRSAATFPRIRAQTSVNTVPPATNCRWVEVNGRLIQVCNP